MPRLLIVADQKKLLNSLQRVLEEKGYEVIAAQTGEQGYYAASTEPIDAMVLDLMLPGRDGVHVLRDLRANGFTRPVLILTARNAIEDKVLGLDVGVAVANDAVAEFRSSRQPSEPRTSRSE